MELVLLGSLLLLLAPRALAICPDREAMTNLNITRLLGRWYRVKEREVNYPGIENIKCISNELQQGDNGVTDIVYTHYNSTAGVYENIEGELRKASAGSTDGKFLASYGDRYSGIKYYVLDTDYDNYSVLWLCRSKSQGEGNWEGAMVESRQRILDAEHLAQANAALPTGNYRDVDQSNCPEREHN